MGGGDPRVAVVGGGPIPDVPLDDVLDIHVHVRRARKRREPVAPAVVGLHVLIVDAYRVSHPFRETFADLAEVQSVAAARSLGFVEQRAVLSAAHVVEQSLVAEMLVERHFPVVSRLGRRSVQTDVVEALLYTESRGVSCVISFTRAPV